MTTAIDEKERVLEFRDDLAQIYDRYGAKTAFHRAADLADDYGLLERWQVAYVLFAIAKERGNWSVGASAVSSYAALALEEHPQANIPPEGRCAYLALAVLREFEELGGPAWIDPHVLEEDSFTEMLALRVAGEW